MTNTNTYKISGRQFVVRDVVKCAGGVTYDHEEIEEHAINNGEGKQRRFETKKRVDHVEIVKKADVLAGQARYAFKKHCADTDLGWVCSEAELVALMSEVNALAAEGDALNHEAERACCGRRIHIRAVPIRLEIDNELAAKEISRTVRESLGALLDALRTHDPKAIRKAWLACNNLERLAIGMHKYSIDDAKACTQTARKEINKAKKEGRDPVLDLDAIEAAIGMFVDLDEVTTSPFELEAVA